MKTATDLTVVGYSGHAYVVIDALLQAGLQPVSYCDVTEKEFNPFNLTYLGPETGKQATAVLKDDRYFVAIGDNKLRKKVSETILARPLACIHPQAQLGLHTEHSAGCLVGVNAVVNSLASIGPGAIINSGAIVEHESQVGPYAHIAPGAVLAGNVRVGEGAFVGAGAVVRQGVTIGDWAVVGAGAVVLRDVPAAVTVVGNPARILAPR